MWVATTDEEANFIFDLHNAPDPGEPTVRYAEWLENRDNLLAAEFLRLTFLMVQVKSFAGTGFSDHLTRLQILRDRLDARWLKTVSSGLWRRGDTVRIIAGPCEGMDGTIVGVDGNTGKVHLAPNLMGCFPPVHTCDVSDVQVIRRARHRDNHEAQS